MTLFRHELTRIMIDCLANSDFKVADLELYYKITETIIYVSRMVCPVIKLATRLRQIWPYESEPVYPNKSIIVKSNYVC